MISSRKAVLCAFLTTRAFLSGCRDDKGSTGDTGLAGLAGATGPAGPAGATGPAGRGFVAGGATGQVLSKASAVDFDTQ
jgi:hypothetical protein